MNGSESSRPSSPLRYSSVSPSSAPSRSRQSFSETLMEEEINNAEAIINKVNLDFRDNDYFLSLFVGDDRKDATMFLEAVNSLQNAMHYYLKQCSSSEKLVRAQSIMLAAVKRLEKEFYMILSANRKVLDKDYILGSSSPLVSPPSSSSTSGFTKDNRVPGNFISTSGIAMADLRNIADTMIGSGYGK